MLAGIIEREVVAAVAEAVNGVIILIQDSDTPIVQAHIINWVIGGNISGGQSMPEVAKALHITKQAFQQGARRTREKLRLRKTRAMRSADACDHMRASYAQRSAVRGQKSEVRGQKTEVRGQRSAISKMKVKALFLFNLRSSALAMTRWLRQQILAAPIATWSKQRRACMRIELQGIVDIHAKLEQYQPNERDATKPRIAVRAVQDGGRRVPQVSR